MTEPCCGALKLASSTQPLKLNEGIQEQNHLCQMQSFKMAFVVWFITHYVFNLEYSKQMREVVTFVREFVFGLPNKVKSATYLTVSSDSQKLGMCTLSLRKLVLVNLPLISNCRC